MEKGIGWYCIILLNTTPVITSTIPIGMGGGGGGGYRNKGAWNNGASWLLDQLVHKSSFLVFFEQGWVQKSNEVLVKTNPTMHSLQTQQSLHDLIIQSWPVITYDLFPIPLAYQLKLDR